MIRINKYFIAVVLSFALCTPHTQGTLAVPFPKKVIKSLGTFTPKRVATWAPNSSWLPQWPTWFATNTVQSRENRLMLLPENQQTQDMQRAYQRKKNRREHIAQLVAQAKKTEKFRQSYQHNHGDASKQKSPFISHTKKVGYSLFAMLAAFFGWQTYQDFDQTDDRFCEQDGLSDQEQAETTKQEQQLHDDLLFKAVLVGNINGARQQLEAGANPDDRLCHQGFCMPLLSVAVMQKNEEMIKLLLEYNADVNAVDDAGKQVIFYALEQYLIEPKQNLIEPLLASNNLDVNAADKWGYTVLYFLAKADNPNFDLMQKLIDKGAKISGFTVRADETAMPYETSMLIEVIRLMLKHATTESTASDYAWLSAGYSLKMDQNFKETKLRVFEFFLEKATQEDFDRIIAIDDIRNKWLEQPVSWGRGKVLDLCALTLGGQATLHQFVLKLGWILDKRVSELASKKITELNHKMRFDYGSKI